MGEGRRGKARTGFLKAFSLQSIHLRNYDVKSEMGEVRSEKQKKYDRKREMGEVRSE